MFRSRSLVSMASPIARAGTLSITTRSRCLHTTIINNTEPLVPVIPGGGISHWKTDEGVPFTRENVLDLLYGKTPLIREPGFLTADECWKYEEALSPFVTPYKHNTGPVLRRVGIAQV